MSSWLKYLPFSGWWLSFNKPPSPHTLQPPFTQHIASPVLMNQVEKVLRDRWEGRAEIQRVFADPFCVLGFIGPGNIYEVNKSVHILLGRVAKVILVLDPHLNERIGAILIKDKDAPVCIGRDFYDVIWFAPRKYNEKELIRGLESLYPGEAALKNATQELTDMTVTNQIEQLRKLTVNLLKRHWPDGFTVGETYQLPQDKYVLEFSHEINRDLECMPFYKLKVIKIHDDGRVGGVLGVVCFRVETQYVGFTGSPDFQLPRVAALVANALKGEKIEINGTHDHQRLGPWEGIINTEVVRALREGVVNAGNLVDGEYGLRMTPVRDMPAPHNVEYMLVSLRLQGLTLATGVISPDDVVSCQRSQGVSESCVNNAITGIAARYGWNPMPNSPSESQPDMDPFDLYLHSEDEPLFVNIADGTLCDNWVRWYAAMHNVPLSQAVMAGLHQLEGLASSIQKHLRVINGPGDTSCVRVTE